MKRALLGTLPGRAIVIGLVVKLAALALRLSAPSVPPFVAVVDTVAGILIAIGGAALLVGGLASATRKLLWRVRRKLILSYIFIGFVPAVLIVAFFLLSGLLLFSNFGAYLLQSRLRALTDRARSIAEETALDLERGGDPAEIASARQRSAQRQFAGASLIVVPADRTCSRLAPGPESDRRGEAAGPVASGPWAHVDPPREVPEWIGCDGFDELLAYDAGAGERRIVARAAALPPSARPRHAVVVDLPIDGQAREELRRETGVWVSGANIVGGDMRALPARAAADRAGATAAAEAGPQPRLSFFMGRNNVAVGLPVDSVTFIDTRDWATGAQGRLMVTLQLNISGVYNAMAAAQGSAARTFGQGLLLALLVIGLLLLFIQAVALIVGLTLAKSITGSVHELFVGTERVRQGDFTYKIAVTTSDQLGELAQSFNTMTAGIEESQRQAAEKKRLEEELRIAHEIQMSLLPQGPVAMPGLSVTAVCVPAREVGGDYYDFFPLGDRRLGILIADVSGKGTSAALYMAELKGLMLSLSRIYTSPRALLIAANRIISEHLDPRSFITMSYAVVDLGAGTMTYARAGHTPLVYVPGSDPRGQAQILTPDGLVLGLKIDKGELFERLLEERMIPLCAGDVYVFFTDGVSEAMNAREDLFGEQRLGRLVEEHAHLPSGELRERVLRDIASFVDGAPQHDDMTLILLKVEQPAPAPLVDDSRFQSLALEASAARE